MLENWKEKNIFFNSRHLRVSNYYTKNSFAVKYCIKLLVDNLNEQKQKSCFNNVRFSVVFVEA